MRVVLLQGAFEILNAGHVQVFKRCRAQGDMLIVALNTNKLLKKYKGRDAVLPFSQKKKILEAIRWVDKVVPAHDFSPMKLLEKYNVDVYCLSREWQSTKDAEIEYMKKKGGKVFFTRDYKVVRTSGIKKSLLAEAEDQSALERKAGV